MGPKKSESEKIAIRLVFEKHKCEIYMDNKLAPKKNEVWSQMSAELNHQMSENALYTAAIKNYYGLGDIIVNPSQVTQSQTLVCDDSEIINSETSEADNYSDNEEFDDVASSDDSANSRLKFEVILAYKEYTQMGPTRKYYKRNDDRDVRKRHNRERRYYVLEEFNWTHILREKINYILEMKKCHCIIMFKRCKIYPTSVEKYAKFFGYCSQCDAILHGFIIDEPQQDSQVVIHFELTNFSKNTFHSKKRPLSGKKRIDLAEKLISTNMAPTQYRNKMASEKMKFGAFEPQDLPSPNVMRVAKHELLKKRRLDDDVTNAILKMKVNPKTQGAIRNISVSPFIVHYWTNIQVHVYNKYHSKGHSKISIDATGGVVSKITRITGDKTRTIFLYDITVNDHLTKQQYSVCNMLSESHTGITIQNWLEHWLQSGAKKPSEVVTDMSKALIYACIRAFSQRAKSILQYTLHLYNVLCLNEPLEETCYIRIDVAHMMKLISTWSCLKRQHPLTRQLYMRSMGQMIQSTSILDLEDLVRALATVALSDTEGHNSDSLPTSCEIRKKWLIQRAATATIQHDGINVDENTHSTSSGNDCDTDNPFNNWMKTIVDECKTFVNQGKEIGDRGNQQYLPEFIEELQKHASTIPLWTALLQKQFPSAGIIGSSASVESNFNNIKHRTFRHLTLPMRGDEFLNVHIESNDGSLKLVESADSEYVQTISKRSCSNTNKYDNTTKSPNGNVSHTNIVCGSCQLRQISNFQCAICFNEIHINPLCSKLINDKRTCIRCIQRTALDASEDDGKNSIENWRGQAQEVKKRPRSSYLEPCSELLQANYNSLKPMKPIALLRNGHLTDLQPIKMDGLFVSLSNTCGFDSLIQILSGTYCDSDCFKELVDLRMDNSKLCQLIRNLTAEHGVTRKTYRLRAEILENVFQKTSHPQNFVHVDCVCSIGQLISKILTDFKCAVKYTKCLGCDYRDEIFLSSLEIELQPDLRNFCEDVEHFLNFKSLSRHCARCNYNLVESTDIALTHFIIEPVNVQQLTLYIQISLNKLPRILKLRNVQYILRGVIGYVGPNLGVGHFTGYLYRHNNLWELYDDTQKKGQPCSGSKDVLIMAIIHSL